jgi:hypothetical protein
VTIRSHVANDAYRDGWAATFAKKDDDAWVKDDSGADTFEARLLVHDCATALVCCCPMPVCGEDG